MLLPTLLLGFVATVVLHVARIAGLDRFATSFDLILIAMAALAAADLARIPAPAFAGEAPDGAGEAPVSRSGR